MRPRLRTRTAVLAGLASVAATAAGALSASAAPKAKTRDVSCSLTLFATIPQPAPTAANFGSARCDRGFGFGVQRDSSVTTRTSVTTGSFTGPFKLFFDRGTISGTFTISFVTTLTPAFTIAGVAYTGTLKVTKGTGAYTRTRGSGTLTGTSPDAVKTSLSYKLRLTG